MEAENTAIREQSGWLKKKELYEKANNQTQTARNARAPTALMPLRL